MPWCPICKEEYKEGTLICPDCNADLVDTLPDENSEFLPVYSFETKELADKFASYLSYSGIMAIEETTSDGLISISVRKKEIKKAKRYFAAFYSVEATNQLANEFAEMQEDEETLYVDPETELTSRSKQEVFTRSDELGRELDEMISDEEEHNTKSKKVFAAFMFTLFGFMVFFFGRLIVEYYNLKFTGYGILIGILVVYALCCYFYLANKYVGEEIEKVDEETLSIDITKWLENNFPPAVVDTMKEKLEEKLPDLTPEAEYFELYGQIKDATQAKFHNCDEVFVATTIDDYIKNSLPEIENMVDFK